MFCEGIFRDNKLANGPHIDWGFVLLLLLFVFLNLIFFINKFDSVCHTCFYLWKSTLQFEVFFSLFRSSLPPPPLKREQQKMCFDKWDNWFSMLQSDGQKSKYNLWLLVLSFIYNPEKTMKWKYQGVDANTNILDICKNSQDIGNDKLSR